ncbi:hypothetical protein BMF94_4643 [Rhodotorula taiwanensis]|uniref:Uncharacterized protein n=1 Tax=Rhodotorula taiwanensis TaxID=741276 RepID=A0A2S5B6K1_9BASI|nr:hypothetical protein BMF94_4643 [Rhodotorula taiwanensis]
MQVDAEPLGPPPRTQHARDASRTSKASRASTLSTMQKLDLAVETRRRASGPVRPRRARYKDPTGPEDFLQLGIALHEAGHLERATSCFEKSSTISGGCCSGMLLHGLALRHGWGCKVDLPRAFGLFRQAATSHTDGLALAVERFLTPREEGSRIELALALYELAVSYRFGWGVERNKPMAVSYFRLASELGDPDAQQDLDLILAGKVR